MSSSYVSTLYARIACRRALRADGEQVVRVEPPVGPAGGDTLLTITGTSFGSPAACPVPVVTVGGKRCRVVDAELAASSQ